MKGFAVRIEPLVHGASITTIVAKEQGRAVRDGKGGRREDSRREQVKHGSGLARVRETRRAEESGKMSGEKLTITINEVEANGRASRGERMMMMMR